MTATVASPAPPTTSTRILRFALLAAAPLWLLGWAIMRVDGKYGPGPGWTSAHLIWVVAFALFGFASLALFRIVGGNRRDVPAVGALGVAVLGAVTLVGQMLIDIAVGLGATDKAAMRSRYDDVFAVPGVELVLFQVGPSLLFVGLLALVVIATVRRRVRVTTLALVLLGVAMMVAGRPLPGWLRTVEGLGAVSMALALAPLSALVPARRR
ncbi:MAG TPA: hypothetical protein VK453_06805 [Micromonosporaceae bacterium]|nr:hypothetical protein [Micromonosporaceae bacterium]